MKVPPLVALAGMLVLQFSGLEVREPGRAEDARVTATLDRAEFLLGEYVQVHYCLDNLSRDRFSISMGGDYRGGSRSHRFKVAVTDSTGGTVPDPDPGGFHLGGLSSVPEVAPGATWCHSIPLHRYARIDTAGNYTIRVTHDLGWKTISPPAGEGRVSFRMPSETEAQRVVADTLRLPSDVGVSMDGKPSAARQDWSVVRYPIYLRALRSLAESGNAGVLAGIGAMATPEATRVLIALQDSSEAALSLAAARTLAMRLPDPALQGALPARGPFENNLEDPRRYLRDAAWRQEFANDVRMAARRWVASDDPARQIQGAFMLQAVGLPGDVPALAQALSLALNRIPALLPESGYPRPRGATQELMRAAEVLTARGATPVVSPQSAGETLLWLVAFARGVRPPQWEMRMRDWLAHPVPYVREQAVKALAADAPPALLDAAGGLVRDSDVDVQIAALDLISTVRLRQYGRATADVLRTASEIWVFRGADNALYALGERWTRLEGLASRLRDPAVADEALMRLIASVADSRGGASTRTMSEQDRLAVSARWARFLEEHRAHLESGGQFSFEDAAMTSDLVPAGWTFTRQGKPDWPRGKQAAGRVDAPGAGGMSEVYCGRENGHQPGADLTRPVPNPAVPPPCITIGPCEDVPRCQANPMVSVADTGGRSTCASRIARSRLFRGGPI